MSKTLEQLLQEARAFTKVSKHKEAQACYDQMLEINPNHVDALLGRGMTEQGLGKSKDGLPFIDRAIEADPNRALAYSRKAMLLKDMGDLEKALEFVDKAVAFGPTAPNADIILNEKGIVLRQLGRLEEAIESYKKAAEINPNRSNSYWGLGITLQRLEREEEALEAYKTLVKIEPCSMFYLLLGKCYQKLNREKEALEAFVTCVDYYDQGQPGPMLSIGNLTYIKNELRGVKELQVIAAKAEAKVGELELKAQDGHISDSIVQEFLSKFEALQEKKGILIQSILSKNAPSEEDKQAAQRLKDEFAKELQNMDLVLQKYAKAIAEKDE